MMFNASGKLVITLGVAAVGVYGATNALHLDELLNANLFHFSSRAFSEIAQDSKEAHFAVLRSKNAKQDTMMMTREREDADYLKVVEIGIGIGANFQFMPSRTAVIGVDPNPYFEKFVRRNADKYPNVRLESFIVGKGENLEDISSSSADVVITTLVLCQTKDKRKFLAEILRILVPGGKYLFWEHLDAYVRSAETDSNRKLLEHHSKDRSPHDRRGYHCRRFTLLMDYCYITLGIYQKHKSKALLQYKSSEEEDAIAQTGFQSVEFEVFQLPSAKKVSKPTTWFAERLASSYSPTLHLRGIATKARVEP